MNLDLEIKEDRSKSFGRERRIVTFVLLGFCHPTKSPELIQ